MLLAPIPDDDVDRLDELLRLGILDTHLDEQLDRLTVAAAQHFGAAISLISLVDQERVWFKSKFGLEDGQSDRDVSFCSHVVMDDEPFIVANAQADARFADHPFVTGAPHIGFYAGYPLKGPGGHRIGSLCVIDREPRSMCDSDLLMLRVLAEAAQSRITEIWRARKLEYTTDLLAAATSAAGIGLWEWDIDRDTLTWDEQQYVLYGTKAADFAGAYGAWLAGLHPDDVEATESAVQLTLAGESDYDIQFRVVWPSGEIRWIQAKATVTRDRDGRPISMLGLNWDITAEKSMEATLSAAAAREATTDVMEHIEAAICELPIVLYGAGLAGNAAAQRWLLGKSTTLTGVSKAAFEAGEDLLGNVSPVDRARVERELSTSRTAGSESVSQQFRIRGNDGTERWFQHVAKLDHAAREQTGALLDIDNAKRFALRLQESEKMEALGRLAGGVAHDFNNILGVIASFATFVREASPDDGEVRADIDEVLAATDRAEAVTRQLLTISKEPTEVRPMDVNEHVVALAQFLSTAVGAGVELNIQPCDEPAVVRIDPAQFDRVIVNLVVNARDAMPGGGKLSIVVRRERGQSDGSAPCARLTVSDTGGGMDPQTASHIFEPFYTTKADGLGTGLGLFNCFGIVADAGGTITCASKPNVGTTITVDLPLLEDIDTDVASDSTPTAPSEPTAPTGPRAPVGVVLIVEDDRALRTATSRVLEGAGYRVYTAGDGGAAKAIVEELGPQLQVVLSDVRMPGCSGIEIAQHVAAVTPSTAVVLTSGYVEEHDLAQVKGSRILWKPVKPADLLAAIKDATRSPSAPSYPLDFRGSDPSAQNQTPMSGERAVKPVLATTAPQSSKRSPSASILIVEDESALAEASRRILERASFAVTTAATIAAARGALRESDFDLLISDIALPDGNGMDFLHELRVTHENLPVVILTGQPTFDAARRAINDRATEFLIKPVAAADLTRVAASAIVRGRQLKLRNDLVATHEGGEEFLADLPGAERAFDAALSSLRMHFQPIVHTRDSSVFGYEALLRCDGAMFASPLRFISAAEVFGRIHEVGLVVRSAIAEVMESHQDRALTMFVNLHPAEVRADVLSRVTEPLLPFASQIVLEITERAALDSGRLLDDDLDLLRDQGYRFAIDDLGEGYSGLNSLVRVNPDIAKIDMSLVRGIDRAPLKRDIVSAIIDMSRQHRISIVAEGVETVAERATLRELGCDLLQGYLFAKPGPPFVDHRTAFDD